MRGGVTQRFGDDIMSKLAKVGQVPMVSESTLPWEGQGVCRGERRSPDFSVLITVCCW